MYLIIPLILVAIAIFGICYILFRKFVFLKKLSPEAISNPPATSGTFWKGMFPEIISLNEKINWREQRVNATTAFEKLVRRVRLLFLKLDTASHNLSNRLRRSAKRHEAILEKEEALAVAEQVAPPTIATIDPKEEEQHLIMEIAKNPKDAGLYKKLGDVYIKTQETDNALASFETALKLNPDDRYAKQKVKELAKEDVIQTIGE